MSNYPPGMTSRDLDHVHGVSRCEDCGASLPERTEGEPLDDNRCPRGCRADIEADDLYDRMGDR